MHVYTPPTRLYRCVYTASLLHRNTRTDVNMWGRSAGQGGDSGHPTLTSVQSKCRGTTLCDNPIHFLSPSNANLTNNSPQGTSY